MRRGAWFWLVAALGVVSCGRVGFGVSQANSDASLFDAPSPDAQPPSPALEACSNTIDEYTLALYRFEGNVRDDTDDHNAVMVNTALFEDGPALCSSALAFGDVVAQPTVEVADSADWRLESGSIELWMKVATLTQERRAIISRDAALQDTAGHLTLWLIRDVLVLRVQTLESDVIVCTSVPVEPDVWNDIAINVGAPSVEMYVGGVAARSTAVVDLEFTTVRCGAIASAGIAGNSNPWVFGGGTANSDEGTSSPLIDLARGTSIDHVRISRARRLFAQQ